METVNRLTDVLVTMNTPADRGKLFKIIKMLYGLMGLPFSEEAEPMDADPAVLEYFIFSFTADFGEVMQDTDSRRNRNSDPHRRRFSLSHWENRNAAIFYALMLRSRGKKSLDLSGLQDAKQRKQGKDTLPLKIAVLLRNKSKAKE